MSQDGTLAYADWRDSHNELVWRDRNGTKIGSLGPGSEPRISPDGSRVAYVLDGDVLVYDIKQQASIPITTGHPGDMRPIWAHDGRSLVFTSKGRAERGIWFVDIERGGEPPTLLFRSEQPMVPDHWSSDGLKLAYHASSERNRWHLGVLTKDEHRDAWMPTVFSDTGHSEMMLAFHPKGSFVAYQSYITGHGNAEIYVESFPRGGNQIPISSNRGIQARWSSDGRELFYIGAYRDQDREARDPGIYALSFATAPGPEVGLPHRLFSIPALAYYDVTPDGQRFLISEPPAETPQVGIRIVQNWFEEFRARRESAR
ncbi:MAG: hypothetical protein R2724_25320 [Bryobacterales bacterium]